MECQKKKTKPGITDYVRIKEKNARIYKFKV